MPSTAEIRPDIAALPMLRAPRPEIVSESNFTPAGVCASAVPATKRVAIKNRVAFIFLPLHRRLLRLVRRRFLLLLLLLRLRLHLRGVGRLALPLRVGFARGGRLHEAGVGDARVPADLLVRDLPLLRRALRAALDRPGEVDAVDLFVIA